MLNKRLIIKDDNGHFERSFWVQGMSLEIDAITSEGLNCATIEFFKEEDADQLYFRPHVRMHVSNSKFKLDMEVK